MSKLDERRDEAGRKIRLTYPGIGGGTHGGVAELNYCRGWDARGKELQPVVEALEFYAAKENWSACLIDEFEFKEKYFKKEYILDIGELNVVKDSGDKARDALDKFK